MIRRGKELRSELILRVFAVERFLRFLIFGGAAYAVWRFRYDRAGIQRAFDNALPAVRALYQDLGFNVNHSKLIGLIQHSFTLNSRTLTYLAIGLAVYALIERSPRHRPASPAIASGLARQFSHLTTYLTERRERQDVAVGVREPGWVHPRGTMNTWPVSGAPSTCRLRRAAPSSSAACGT